MSDASRADDDALIGRLRDLFRDAPLSKDDAPEHAAFDDARVAALLRGDMTAGDAVELAQRIPADPDLALAVRVCASLREAIDTLEPAAPKPPEHDEERDNVVSLRTWAWVGVAAAVAAAAVLWLGRGPTLESTPDDQIRASDAPTVRSTLERASLPRDAFVLTWDGGPPEATYDVYVTTEDLVPIDSALDLSTPRYQLDAAVLLDHPPGTRMLWRVVARSTQGRELASPTFEVTLQ